MGKCIVTLHYVVEVANEVANVGITLVIWGYPTSYLFNMLLVWPQSKFYVNNCMEWCCVFTFVCWEMLFYCVNNTQVFPSTDWETKQGILTWRHNLCHRWKNGHALSPTESKKSYQSVSPSPRKKPELRRPFYAFLFVSYFLQVNFKR